MINFLRKIRKQLLSENKFTKYLIYALGEILLIVIGILIALAINNSNENSKERTKELSYLKNIKNDLIINVQEIDGYINNREQKIASAKNILEHFDGKPIEDLETMVVDMGNIYSWRKFFQNNNTYQELINSGNLAIISNDSIQNTLLNLESLYMKLKDEESHFRYDSELLLYAPSYKIIDHHSLVENYKYQLTNGQVGTRLPIIRRQYELMLEDIEQKNGFAMAVLVFGNMNQQLAAMKNQSEELIKLIEIEIKK